MRRCEYLLQDGEPCGAKLERRMWRYDRRPNGRIVILHYCYGHRDAPREHVTVADWAGAA